MYLWEMKKNIFFVFKSAYIIIIRNRDGGEGQEMDYNSTTSNYRQEHYVEAVWSSADAISFIYDIIPNMR